MADVAIGAALGGYRIEALIGHGSMGTVYSAQDVQLERRVALKVLTPELSSDDRFRQRFIRESRLAVSIDHPNIIPVYDAGEADGLAGTRPDVAMPGLPGVVVPDAAARVREDEGLVVGAA